MKTHFSQSLIATVAFALLTSIGFAAPKSNIKERGRIDLTVALEATAEAPVGISASATITVNKPKFNKPAVATLTLTTSGFGEGSYGIDAVLKGDDTPVHLGDFEVGPMAPVDPEPDAPITLGIPEAIDATQIVSLSISDSSAAVILAGEVTSVAGDWHYLANVRITGDVVATKGHGKGPKVKGPSGHLISQSKLKDGVETKRHFLWVGFGAPPETELTINVDGEAVGTVTSNKKGKVMFHSMPDSVVLRDIQLITITDGDDAVVMKATF